MDEPIIDGVQYVWTPHRNQVAVLTGGAMQGAETHCVHDRMLGLSCEECRAMRVKEVAEMKARLGY